MATRFVNVTEKAFQTASRNCPEKFELFSDPTTPPAFHFSLFLFNLLLSWENLSTRQLLMVVRWRLSVLWRAARSSPYRRQRRRDRRAPRWSYLIIDFKSFTLCLSFSPRERWTGRMSWSTPWLLMEVTSSVSRSSRGFSLLILF